MTLNWQSNDYFSLLLHRDKRAHAALEMLVDDLHTEKERTISRFLCHSGSEDFLWGLVRLLGNSNSRVAGNSAYILGTLAESELGCYRVISLTSSTNPEGSRILPDLTNMLTFNDSESVMNAAGTMGTLAESNDGRMWMLGEACLVQTLTHITALLSNDNLWTASNAALVLARLTIAEEGCERLLAHKDVEHILTRLVLSLGVDEAGRGMNAAFAIGRLCDMEWGRNKLLSLPDSEKMVSSLAKMLCCSDTGASKNACFALSCLATNKEGHTRLLKNTHSDEVLKTLSELLSAEDAETGWFAAMTLRTLASQPKGCLRLRDHQCIIPALKAIQERSGVSQDLMDEVLQTLEVLKRLDKSPAPTVQVLGATEIKVTWTQMTTKSGFSVRYHLFEESKCVYQGRDLSHTLQGLQPHTQYTFRVRAVADGDEGALSDPVTVTTEESVPGPVSNLRVLGATTTQLKVAWDPPTEINGILRGYVLTAGKVTEHTNDTTYILTGLTQNTTYEVQVCAHTSTGKGPRESVIGTTSELGAHAPSKPEVIVRGRNELHVSWKPPEVPLGRISRYDLLMDGEAVYSGTELHYTVHRLQPNTDYSFQVVAITSEGKCESKTTRRKTAKDGFEGERAPLYPPPVKKEQEVEQPKPTQIQKKRKSVSHSNNTNTVTSDAPSPKSASARATSASSSKSRRQKTPISDHHEAVVVRRGSAVHRDHETPRRRDSGSKLDSELSEPARPQSLSAKSRVSRTSEVSELSLGRSSTTVTKETLPKPKKYDGLPKAKPTGRHATRAGKSLELSNGLDSGALVSRKLSRKKSVENEDILRASTPTTQEKKPISRAIANVTQDLLAQAQNKSRLSQNTSVLNADQGLDRRNSASEPDNRWLTHSRRQEQPADLSNTFSSLQLSNYRDQTFKPSSSHAQLRAGLIELDAALPLPNHKSSPLPPAQIQRTNTMVGAHRPGIKRNLDKLSSSRGLPGNNQQWKPDFPSSPQVERSHNKFVPMQLRTQPANLPSGMQRQVSNLALLERGHTSLRLDFLPRQTTEIDLRNPVYMYGPAYKEEDEHVPFNLNNGQSIGKERLPSGRSSITTSSDPGSGDVGSTQVHGAARQRTDRATTMAPSLALSPPTSNETKMQSAR